MELQKSLAEEGPKLEAMLNALKEENEQLSQPQKHPPHSGREDDECPHDKDYGRQTPYYGTCPPWLEWKEDPEFGKDLYLRCKLCAKWVCDEYDTRSPTTYDGIHGKTSEKNSKEHKKKLNAASSLG